VTFVSFRAKCYEEICQEVGKHGHYLKHLVDHLLNHKLGHFDHEIRSLASVAFGLLYTLLDSTTQTTLIEFLRGKCLEKDSFYRCGALLTLSEILPTNELKDFDYDPYMNLLARITEMGFTDGIGDEITRLGLNRLIFALCQLKSFSIDESTGSKWIDLLLANMKSNPKWHFNEKMLLNARNSLKTLTKTTSHFSVGFKQDLIKKLAQATESSTLESEATAAAYALGSVPSYICDVSSAGEYLEKFSTMIADVSGQKVGWVELRSACLVSTVDLASHAYEMKQINDFDVICKILKRGFEDFTTSQKGDIGFSVRKTAVKAAGDFLVLLQDSLDVASVVFGLVALCGDKVDSIRALALAELKRLTSNPNLHFPCREEFIVALNSNGNEFQFLADIFELAGYESCAMLALAKGVGSMNESVAQNAQKALAAYLGQISENQVALAYFMQQVASLCDRLDPKSAGHGGLVLPVLKFLEFLLLLPDGQIDVGSRETLQSLAGFVKTHCAKSQNEQRLLCGISISCALLQFRQRAPNLGSELTGFLVGFLKHRFPFVRQRTAEHLQEALLRLGQLDNHCEQVLALLASTMWLNIDGDDLKHVLQEIEPLLLVAFV